MVLLPIILFILCFLPPVKYQIKITDHFIHAMWYSGSSVCCIVCICDLMNLSFLLSKTLQGTQTREETLENLVSQLNIISLQSRPKTPVEIPQKHSSFSVSLQVPGHFKTGNRDAVYPFR